MSEQVAVLVCDVWDTHWCRTAVAQANSLAPRIERFLRNARTSGTRVLHAPSQCDDHYSSWHQYRRAAALRLPVPTIRSLPAPPDFVPAAACPCSDPCPPPDPSAPWPWPWRRQHPAISIGDDDFIVCDDGQATFGILSDAAIQQLAICGLHLDCCILDRPFGLNAMWRAGIDVIVVGDLTEVSNPNLSGYFLDVIGRSFPVRQSSAIA